jgi:hypothetical protein
LFLLGEPFGELEVIGLLGLGIKEVAESVFQVFLAFGSLHPCGVHVVR